MFRNTRVIFIVLFVLFIGAVVFLTQVDQIASLFSRKDASQNAAQTASGNALKNPLAGYLDSCFSNQSGAGSCGTRLRMTSENTLVTTKITDPVNQNEKQSRTALSLYLAQKGATWRALSPEIGATQITPKTAYIQFYQDLSYTSLSENIDLSVLAAYYELLFSTLEKPGMENYKKSTLPVPPIPFARQYKLLLKAYASPDILLPKESQERLRTLDWSPQAKALVAASLEFLDPAVVKAMFSEEGSLTASYQHFWSALPTDATYQFALSDRDLTQGEFFGQEFKQNETAGTSSKLALCKNQASYLCEIQRETKRIECIRAPYWSNFCTAKTFLTPITVDEVGPD